MRWPPPVACGFSRFHRATRRERFCNVALASRSTLLWLKVLVVSCRCPTVRYMYLCTIFAQHPTVPGNDTSGCLWPFRRGPFVLLFPCFKAVLLSLMSVVVSEAHSLSFKQAFTRHAMARLASPRLIDPLLSSNMHVCVPSFVCTVLLDGRFT